VLSNNQEVYVVEGGDDELDTELLAQAIAEAAYERKAEAIRILDVRGIVSYTDYIVVCHGKSAPHVRAIANFVMSDLRPLKFRPRNVEGLNHAEWVLIDFVDVVFHVFRGEFRSEYAVESIFSDAPRVEFNPEGEAEE
jgi:ribosome-associated protein